MKVTLVVRVINENNELIAAYRQREKLSFIPACGMKFKLGSGSSLWKTADGGELAPPVKEVVYNIDDEELYCLFDIDRPLASPYWEKITNLEKSADLKQFEVQHTSHELPAAVHAEQSKNAGHNDIRHQVSVWICTLAPLGALCCAVLSEVI